MHDGGVVAIYVAAGGAEPMSRVDSVEALAGTGLSGDRYAQGTGTFSKRKGPQRQVTLIEREAIEAAARDHGALIDEGDSRRNIVTRGVSLNHLVGCRFEIGGAVLEGIKLCEPCKHLESLTRSGIRKALVHRGGLNARVVSSGLIRSGDAIRVIAPRGVDEPAEEVDRSA